MAQELYLCKRARLDILLIVAVLCIRMKLPSEMDWLKLVQLMKFLNTEAKKQRRLVHVPMGRFGEAKEMAQAALYLASDESSYVTGTEFLVDGGITAAYVTPE